MKTALMSFIAAAVVCMAVSVGDCSDNSGKKDAVAAAQSWLSLVDSGRYEQSWQEAAEYFKGAVREGDWSASMNAFRKPLGKVLEREEETSRYATSLPGAPDGEYVVIQYRTRFENKEQAVETVTPMLDKDGVWRVSGYYIK